MAVAYYTATAIFFTTGVTVHVFVHYLRLDMLDELQFWREHDEEEEAARRMMNTMVQDNDVERSDSFEMKDVGTGTGAGRGAH